MLRVDRLRLALDGREEEVLRQTLRKLKLRPEDVSAFRLAKISVDARDQRDVHFAVSAELTLRGDEQAVLRRLKPGTAVIAPETPPLAPPPLRSTRFCDIQPSPRPLVT